MTEELQHLWSLRDLDEQLVAVNDLLSRLPEQRKDLERRIALERRRLEDLRARVAELQMKRRLLERETETAIEQERKFQSQLPSVKKNEEYTALLHEIASSKTKRSDVETQVLLQLEEEEQMQKERPQIEQALRAAEKEAADRGAQIDREEGEARARAAALQSERAAHLEHLSAPTRTRYERIHVSRGGRAVVPILKSACGGCFRGLPPQLLQDARRGDRLLSCEGCGRLLIWPPEAA